MSQHQLSFLSTLWFLLNSLTLSCLGIQDSLIGSARLSLSYFLLSFLIRILILQALSVASLIYVYLHEVLSDTFSDTASTVYCSLIYLKFLFYHNCQFFYFDASTIPKMQYLQWTFTTVKENTVKPLSPGIC